MAAGLHLEAANELSEVAAMMSEARVVCFTVAEPFDAALRKLRKALAAEGLSVACEIDTTSRLKQQLGVALRKCVVLYVDDPIHLLEATVIHPAGGLFVPLPVVLSGSETSCRISVRSIEPVFSSDLPATLRGAVAHLHEMILAAVQRIGSKHTAASEIAECTTAPA
jgi:uncharacterized protein (DUF302 family)